MDSGREEWQMPDSLSQHNVIYSPCSAEQLCTQKWPVHPVMGKEAFWEQLVCSLTDCRSLILRNKSPFTLSMILPLFQLLRWVCCISETKVTKCSPGCPGENFGRSIRADASPGGCRGYVCWRKWVTALFQGMPEIWEVQVTLLELPQTRQGFILSSLQTFT